MKSQPINAFAGNILTFSQGCNIGWYSPALPVINSVPSTLIDGPISHDMAGVIGSLLAVGAIFGNLFFGFLANWIGYRRSMLLSAIPIFVSRCHEDDDKHVISNNFVCYLQSSWLFIIFGNYAWHICVSRFLAGITGGSVFTLLPQFIAQIASDQCVFRRHFVRSHYIIIVIFRFQHSRPAQLIHSDRMLYGHSRRLHWRLVSAVQRESAGHDLATGHFSARFLVFSRIAAISAAEQTTTRSGEIAAILSQCADHRRCGTQQAAAKGVGQIHGNRQTECFESAVDSVGFP